MISILGWQLEKSPILQKGLAKLCPFPTPNDSLFYKAELICLALFSVLLRTYDSLNCTMQTAEKLNVNQSMVTLSWVCDKSLQNTWK